MNRDYWAYECAMRSLLEVGWCCLTEDEKDIIRKMDGDL